MSDQSVEAKQRGRFDPPDQSVEAKRRGRFVRSARRARHHPSIDISDEPHQARAPPTVARVLELERLITLREASELTSMSVDSLTRHYRHLIRHLSPRRPAMRLGDVLQIGSTA